MLRYFYYYFYYQSTSIYPQIKVLLIILTFFHYCKSEGQGGQNTERLQVSLNIYCLRKSRKGYYVEREAQKAKA